MDVGRFLRPDERVLANIPCRVLGTPRARDVAGGSGEGLPREIVKHVAEDGAATVDGTAEGEDHAEVQGTNRMSGGAGQGQTVAAVATVVAGKSTQDGAA